MTDLTTENLARERRDAAGVMTAVNAGIEPDVLADVRPSWPAPSASKFGDAAADTCSSCLRYEFSLCAVLNAAGVTGAPLLRSTAHIIPARRTICHAKEWSEFVTIVCDGWAASSTALPDGRRQIHSILLPGDLVLSTGPFNPVFGHTVDAITEVTCRRYKRTELEALVLGNAELFRRLTAMWSEARAQGSQLALSLGRRTAHERIACFILLLAEGLSNRGMTSGGRMPFPLRLKHIADATGLTPVHVSKVQTEFQRHGLIEIKDRSLTILNQAELRHIAGPQ